MKTTDRVRWFSRRAFLGGAGTLLALPAFESFRTRDARAAGPPPKRFLAWYFACGVPAIGEWRPTATGANYPLSPLLSELAPIKNKVSVLSGLRNVGNGPDHTFGTGAFLTGNLISNGSMGGASIDQVIANALQAGAGKTPLHSLQLGIKDNVCERQDICSFLNNVSYGMTGTAITKQMDAVAAFNRLFMGTSPVTSDAAAQQRQALRKSVLDVVTADANRLRLLLSASDKLRFEEYLTSVRQVEQRVTSIGAALTCSQPTALTATPTAGIDAEIDAHTEVMALAFECDLTRVITFMAASGATGKSNLTTRQDYHLDITHRSDPGWQAKFRSVVTWEVKKFSQLLQRLDAKKDVDGVSTILDNTALFCGSEISDGNRHNHDDMPVLLAGGLGGSFTPGQHRVFSNGEYFADLFMYIAKQMGVSVPSFGRNGTGKITAL
jgi:hypothetical protein